MESYEYIEPAYLLVWSVLFFRATRHGFAHAVFSLPFVMIPFVIAGEVFNASLGEGGVYYPGSYFWFPGFQFPFALLLMGGVFGWLVSRSCDIFSSFGKTPTTRRALLVTGYLLGIMFCYPMEIVGTALEYWVIRTSAKTSLEYVGVFVFYSLVCIPGIAIDRYVGRRFEKAAT